MTNESVIPTPATPDVCTSAILIDGTEISGEFHVLAITVNHELNRIPTATLHLQDGEASKSSFPASNTEHFIPGKKIEIKLGYGSKNNTVFKGIIVKHSIKVRKSGSQLIIDCRDEAIKMTHGNKSRYFIDKKDSAIMGEIIGGYGGLTKDVRDTQPELKEVVQYDATDWDFLLFRAEANGMVVNVNDGKVSILPPTTSGEAVVKVQYGATLLELDAEIDARWQSVGIKAKSWNATEQETVTTEAKASTGTNTGNLTVSNLAKVIGGEPWTIQHGGKLSQPELQSWANGRLLRERLAKVRGRARLQGLASLTPDRLIEVSGIGKRFEGQYYISGVRHSLAKGNWETDVQLGLNPELFAETFSIKPLAAAGTIPAVSGLQIGIVTVLEGDPDGEDRIKVKLPLISTDEEGIWARIATLDAGKERGTFFRPEIGDEVVVGFLNEDPRFPVVLGMCHSSAKPSPEPAKDDNHLKGYVSREKLKLTFDDEKKVITLETPGGNKLKLSEEDKGIAIEDQNGNKIVMNDSGVKIESGKALDIKATNDIKMDGANVELKAQTGFKAQGAASAEISGASATLKSDGVTVIKGSIVQIN